MVEEEVEETKVEWDPNIPYRFGPKIFDWGDQRREWLAEKLAFPNFFPCGHPRISLVTGSALAPCENSVGDHFLLKSIKNKIDYSRLHSIEILYNMAHLDREMSGFWAKLPLMLSHPEVEFIWWMDSDTMFIHMVFERYKSHNFIMHGWAELVYNGKNWIGLNTGSFLLRNCQWSLDILDAWAPMRLKGKIRLDAGKLLTRSLVGWPEFEADDQSALVYLLITEGKMGGIGIGESGQQVQEEFGCHRLRFFVIVVGPLANGRDPFHWRWFQNYLRL